MKELKIIKIIDQMKKTNQSFSFIILKNVQKQNGKQILKELINNSNCD